jgi:hypothetical protein
VFVATIAVVARGEPNPGLAEDFPNTVRHVHEVSIHFDCQPAREDVFDQFRECRMQRRLATDELNGRCSEFDYLIDEVTPVEGCHDAMTPKRPGIRIAVFAV